MKKVGIITFHAAKNYGACLQAYALQVATRAMGVYSIIIDYQPNSVYLQYKKFNLKKYFTAANIRQGLQLLVSDLIYAMPNAKGNAAFSRFKKEYMLLTKELYRTSAQMKTQIPWFDAVIVGSDQVWNTEITGGVDPIYMLENFHAPTKKISYAASLGLQPPFGRFQCDFRSRRKRVRRVDRMWDQ